MIDQILKKRKLLDEMKNILNRWHYAVDKRDYDYADKLHDDYYKKKKKYDKLGKIRFINQMKGPRDG